MTRDVAKRQILRGHLLPFVLLAFAAVKPDSACLLSFHHAVIADAFERAFLGMVTRAVINAPPRSMKSFICSVAGGVLGRRATA